MKFYVYELVVVPDGNVCYVGKGTRRRMYVHKRNLRYARTSQYGLYRRLRSLLDSGKDFKPRKVFETDVEWVALEEEKRRIALYGFDNLFNSTTIEGKTVKSIDDMQRQAMSKSRRDYVAKLLATTGHKMPPAVAAKISAANAGKKKSAESIQKRLAAERRNPEIAAKRSVIALKMVAMHTGKKRSAAYCAKLSALHLGKPMPAGHGDAVSKGLTGKGNRVGATSKYRGVTWFKPKKAWQCRIQVDRKTKLLGQFKLELDAAWTYDNAYELAHGSRPNGTPLTHAVTRFSWKGRNLPPDVVAKRVAGKRARASGPRGVVQKGGKWQARLCRAGAVESIGVFGTEVEARKAYDDRYQLLAGIRPNGTLK